MSIPPIVQQISDLLASARCEQDLDHALSGIGESDWQLFINYMFSLIQQMEESEPERAQSMRVLMHSYLEGWHRKKRRTLLGN